MSSFVSNKYYYLIRLQFLGFRYHGWQKQPGVKTIQEMVEKTIKYVLGKESKFKILGASRTDAMVSAIDFPFELFLEQELTDTFLEDLNQNLPPDIAAKSITQVDNKFNVIKDVEFKEYHYHFSFGNEKRPFQTPFSYHLLEKLDVDEMKVGAKCFEGCHDFRNYSYPYEKVEKKRKVFLSKIVKMEQSETSNDEGYLLKVRSKGFMRHQIRLMMGALFLLGEGVLSVNSIKQTLRGNRIDQVIKRAPASGLLLYSVSYKYQTTT